MIIISRSSYHDHRHHHNLVGLRSKAAPSIVHAHARVHDRLCPTTSPDQYWLRSGDTPPTAVLYRTQNPRDTRTAIASRQYRQGYGDRQLTNPTLVVNSRAHVALYPEP
eukprot:1827384-Rhodomonas_salina.5